MNHEPVDPGVSPWWIALGTLIGSAVSALGAFLISLLKQKDKSAATKSKLTSKERKDTLDEWRELVEKWRTRSELQDQAIQQHQCALEALTREHTECMEDNAQLHSVLHIIYGLLKNAFSQLTKLGADPGELPELPPPRRRRPTDSEYQVRQAKHAVGLLAESVKTIPNPVSPPPAAKEKTNADPDC